MTARTKKKEGVTLIELVMVIVAVGVIVGVATMYINEVVDLWSFMSFRTDVVNQARLSVARMSREMRQVKNATSVQAAEAHRSSTSPLTIISRARISGATRIRWPAACAT